MPTLEWNKREFDGRYPWPDRGDEWSIPWGGPAMQWHGSILPRIQAYLPADTILELACGFGRWTHYLHRLCQRFIGIDLSARCIAACQQRFRDVRHATFEANDGKSLAAVPDGSVDFIFSYDSLVHVEPAVLDAYLAQFPRILKRDGVAFIHHSNLGAYPYFERVRVRPRAYRMLMRLGILEFMHLRDGHVTAAMVARMAGSHGLTCIAQELTPWRERRTLMDCMSVIVRKDSSRARPNAIWRNYRYADEVRNLAMLARHYR